MEPLSITLKKVINAPIEKVFKAWIDPQELKEWHHPEGYTTPAAAVDSTIGGKYSITMQGPDHGTDVAMGTYKEIEPPYKLVFSWGWLGDTESPETLVTVLLKELTPNQTELTLLHEHFATEASLQGHKSGWDGALSNLSSLLVK